MEVQRLLKDKIYLDQASYDAYLENTSKEGIIKKYFGTGEEEKEAEESEEKKKKEPKGHDAPPERGWDDNADYIDIVKHEGMVQNEFGMRASMDRVIEVIRQHGILGVVDFGDKITIVRYGMDKEKTYMLVARATTQKELFTHVSINIPFGRTLYGKKEGEEIEWAIPCSDNKFGEKIVKGRVKRIER